jgi:PKD repeat protein
MIKKEFRKKITAGIITLIIIALIISILIPPAMSISLTIGDTSPTTGLTVGDDVTFSNVNITIENIERIPLVILNFTIFNNNDEEVTNVEFYINGTIKSGCDYFKVTIAESSLNNLANWYTYGYGYGYDYNDGYGYLWNETNQKGYGYGYGDSTKTEITLSYTIVYTTIESGSDFYAKLFAEATHDGVTKIFSSGESAPFSVDAVTPPSPPSSPPSTAPTARHGGPYTGKVGIPVQFDGSASTAVSGRTITSYSWTFGDGASVTGATPTHTYTTAGTYTVRLTVTDNQGETGTATTTATITEIKKENASQDVIDQILQDYNITLDEPFYAIDTTGDGKLDTFVDPNNLLYFIRHATVDGDRIFLLATQDGDMPEFFWNPETDEIIPVTSTDAEVSEPVVDEAAKEITIEITVEKADWIYIKLIDPYPLDEYPDFTLTITTADGRVISSDMIWRENGFIYILDDPDVQYQLIYGYDELPADLIPPEPEPEPEPAVGIPIWIYIIGLVALIIIIIVVALFKTGYLYVEEDEGKKTDKKSKRKKK